MGGSWGPSLPERARGQEIWAVFLPSTLETEARCEAAPGLGTVWMGASWPCPGLQPLGHPGAAQPRPTPFSSLLGSPEVPGSLQAVAAAPRGSRTSYSLEAACFYGRPLLSRVAVDGRGESARSTIISHSLCSGRPSPHCSRRRELGCGALFTSWLYHPPRPDCPVPVVMAGLSATWTSGGASPCSPPPHADPVLPRSESKFPSGVTGLQAPGGPSWESLSGLACLPVM